MAVKKKPAAKKVVAKKKPATKKVVAKKKPVAKKKVSARSSKPLSKSPFSTPAAWPFPVSGNRPK